MYRCMYTIHTTYLGLPESLLRDCTVQNLGPPKIVHSIPPQWRFQPVVRIASHRITWPRPASEPGAIKNNKTQTQIPRQKPKIFPDGK